MELVRHITRRVLKRMAHAICDADPMLESLKGRYKCAKKGCADHEEYCAAFKQAKAAALALSRLRMESVKADEAPPQIAHAA